MTQLPKLLRERASDSVYEAIRNAILTSAFQPGQRLDVRELAAQLGVSPTPIKEAITRLEAEALIEVRPRSGTFVTAVSPEDIYETFEIRCALECLAGEKAIAHASPEDLQRLRAVADSMATASDDSTHSASNVAFHKTIVTLARSDRLRDTYETLDAHIQIARIHLGRRDWTERLSREHAEHLAIVDAISARDRDAAVTALRIHIMRAADSLIRDLRQVSDRVELPATTTEEPTT